MRRDPGSQPRRLIWGAVRLLCGVLAFGALGMVALSGWALGGAGGVLSGLASRGSVPVVAMLERVSRDTRALESAHPERP